jgi:manganese oxidase
MNRSNPLLQAAKRCFVAVLTATAALSAHAGIVGLAGASTGSQRSFDLFAADGYITAADGQQIYMWGFGAPVAGGGTGLMQTSGPTLLVKQGETVIVNFINQLPTRASIIFPGQSAVTTSGGTAGVLAQEVGPGETVTYTFNAGQPGTYLYQSGTQPGLQTEMGMVGALIVYPTGPGVPAASATTRWAYNHAGTAFEREALLVTSDADSKIHEAIDDQVKLKKSAADACVTTGGCGFAADMAHRFPTYWFLNGRTAPDVFAKNAIGELPHQPYNALPRLHPGERILLRMIGAGSDLHPMHHHGNNSWAIAKDGRMLSTDAATRGPNLAFSDYTIKVVPGQTYDAVWTWSGSGIGWDIYGATCNAAAAVTKDNCRFGKFSATGVQTALGACRVAAQPYATCADRFASSQSPITDLYKPIPVKLPSPLELSYGEFYSGSPYLDDFGVRPVGTGLANTTGGFFHMFHSHNEREVVNGGVYPGGMMTMLVIEPFGQAID